MNEKQNYSNLDNYFKEKVSIVAYLVNKFAKQGVETIKVLKLVSFSDIHALRKYGASLTNDKYVALAKGPVASQIRNIVEQNKKYLKGENELKYVKEFLKIKKEKNCYKVFLTQNNNYLKYLSKIDKEVLDEIHSRFGHYNADELIDLSHEFRAWKKYNITGKKESHEIKISDFFINDGCLKVAKNQLEAAKILYEY